MSSTKDMRDNCRLCKNKDQYTITCNGCQQSFCSKHEKDHRTDLSNQRNKLEADWKDLRKDINKENITDNLSKSIDRWEEDSIGKIKKTAEKARNDVKQLAEKNKNESMTMIKQLADQFDTSRTNNHFTEIDIKKWTEQIQKLKEDLNNSFGIDIVKKEQFPILHLISIKCDKKLDDTTAQSPSQSERSIRKVEGETTRSIVSNPTTSTNETTVTLSLQSALYPIYIFGKYSSKDKDVHQLFDQLGVLDPMDKNGPMSGRCERETYQMEQFLETNFGFKNLSGKYIVQGVRAFEIKKPLRSMDPKSIITFPSSSKASFHMTVGEIIEWQRSYKVYAGSRIKKNGESFLQNALQGKTKDGVEAFQMKFVVRISTCPILMEFDGQLIPRKSGDDWPNRIKLVSVTGIDFAGRKHDVGDIIHYVSNWKDLYEVDYTGDTPALANERDFKRKKFRPKGQLEQDRLLNDLTDMAALRLQACDREGVQIVVETGIGLGVFAGEQIGIDLIVRRTSALAIRTVLEKDGPNFKNIRAVIFALPYLDTRPDNLGDNSTFSEFAHVFEDPPYQGRIPVLIADQDMHRLTVAIAKADWTVSQLNPADSHGVFGEYWQNRGPAVEEKLALTTLGLLVQHHIINPNVLNPKNYNFIL